MAFKVWVFVNSDKSPGAALPNDPRMGTVKNKTINKPSMNETTMNGDFWFIQAKLFTAFCVVEALFGIC
jgi:hypothetical protein